MKISEMNATAIRDALNANVDKYNNSNDTAERLDLDTEAKKLVDAYNELSLLTAYAAFMAAERPIEALVRAYYVSTISIKDVAHREVVGGKTVVTHTRSIKDGEKKLSITKFGEWAAERNKCPFASPDWRKTKSAAHKALEAEWRKVFAPKSEGADSHTLSVKKPKEALQAMFDSMVFIPSESGKNAVIAKGSIARYCLAFGNKRKDVNTPSGVELTGSIMSKNDFEVLILDALHMAVEGKTFAITYGTEEGADTEAKKAEAKAEAK